jgi:hypothetical protein
LLRLKLLRLGLLRLELGRRLLLVAHAAKQ